MIGRLLKPVQFQRVLSAPWRLSSVHFTVHFLPAPVAGPAEACLTAVEGRPASQAVPGLSADLSTGVSPENPLPVDETGVSLGMVIPKRHAKRAVTRNLFKRQIRAEVQRRAHELPAGWWVVRLRAAFDRQAFVNAQSQALRRASAQELASLIERGAQRVLVGTR